MPEALLHGLAIGCGLALTLALRDAAQSWLASRRKPAPLGIDRADAHRVIADILNGIAKGERSGMKITGTTALTRDAIRRGAELVGQPPPEF